MLTIVVANITPREAAEHFQRAGLSGTVTESLGFGSWGIEPGARIEFGGQEDAAERATRALLADRREDCAFAHRVRTYTNAPSAHSRVSVETYLVFPDGRREAIA